MMVPIFGKVPPRAMTNSMVAKEKKYFQGKQKQKSHVTGADDVDLLMEHLQVEDVLGVDDLLPDGEGEAVVAVGGVEDAGVIANTEAGFDDALKIQVKIYF